MPKDKSIEEKVENRFFDIITKQEENPNTTAYNIYQKLVFYRFEEIIKNTYPEFCKHISDEDLEKSIYLFLKNPPSTPFVWKIANEYRKMLKKKNYFSKKKYLYELLYFDWIEVEIYMKEYKEKKVKDFSWNMSYNLSSWCRVKKFKYDIINKNNDLKRENFVLIYYDYERDEVLFREINQLLFVLFKRINKNNTISKVLKKLCKENNIDFKEAKKILEEPLTQVLTSKAISKS